jgi:hypothetical protein
MQAGVNEEATWEKLCWSTVSGILDVKGISHREATMFQTILHRRPILGYLLEKF